jgi:hypothetical protein
MTRFGSRDHLFPTRVVLPLLTIVSALLLQAVAARPSAAEPGLESMADTYLRALLEGDGPTVRRLTPDQPENKFGPCPFAEMPRLENPRADLHRAAIMFTGRMRDQGLPGEGAIILTMLDNVKGNPWRVRQIGFFTKLPLGLSIPSRSITRKDRAQEPLVVEAAGRYVAAWLKGDYITMEDLAFNWLARLRPRPQPVTVSSIDFAFTPSLGGETKINFIARVRLYHALPKTLDGTLFAMREQGQWKIRATQLTL